VQPNLTPRSSALLPVHITTARRPDHICLSALVRSRSTQFIVHTSSQLGHAGPWPSETRSFFLPFWRGFLPCYLVCTFWLSWAVCIRFEGTQTTFVDGEKMRKQHPKTKRSPATNPSSVMSLLLYLVLHAACLIFMERKEACTQRYSGTYRLETYRLDRRNVSPGSTTQVKVALICATSYEPCGSAMMSLKPEYTIGDLLERNPTS